MSPNFSVRLKGCGYRIRELYNWVLVYTVYSIVYVVMCVCVFACRTGDGRFPILCPSVFVTKIIFPNRFFYALCPRGFPA